MTLESSEMRTLREYPVNVTAVKKRIDKWHTKLGKFEIRQPVFLFVASFYDLVMKIKKPAHIYKGFFGKKGSELPYYVDFFWKSLCILVTRNKESVQQIQSHLLEEKKMAQVCHITRKRTLSI
jgi:hypothetical protein